MPKWEFVVVSSIEKPREISSTLVDWPYCDLRNRPYDFMQGSVDGSSKTTRHSSVVQ